MVRPFVCLPAFVLALLCLALAGGATPPTVQAPAALFDDARFTPPRCGVESAGRTVEAARLRQTLARLVPHRPFHFFNLGRGAMARADDAAARDLFAKEVARDSSCHEFHFGLAQAHLRLGDREAARRHLAGAAAHSPNGSERASYSAKPRWLQSLH